MKNEESKKDRQIEWHSLNGFYKKRLLFFVIIGEKKFHLYLFVDGREVLMMSYSTLRNAKRSAERVLKRLQEAVK